jgi:hypothetical protein
VRLGSTSPVTTSMTLTLVIKRSWEGLEQAKMIHPRSVKSVSFFMCFWFWGSRNERSGIRSERDDFKTLPLRSLRFYRCVRGVKPFP